MYTSSCACSLLYFLGQTLASALGSFCPVARWICLISQSSSLLPACTASLCLQFLHAAAALALHLSTATDLPVPAASLNAKTTINGPSSYPRCCCLLQHFVSLRSPFTLIHMLVTVSTSAGGQLLVCSHRSHPAAQGRRSFRGSLGFCVRFKDAVPPRRRIPSLTTCSVSEQ